MVLSLEEEREFRMLSYHDQEGPLYVKEKTTRTLLRR
jgi:hypothetical protein